MEHSRTTPPHATKTVRSSAQWLSIVAGTAATLGALAILLADPLVTGNWRLEHGLLPVIVGVTIAACHLVSSARSDRHRGSAAGFAFAFVVGTCLTVYCSVGSQKASTGDKAATVEASNKIVTEKTAALAAARKRLVYAEGQITKNTDECKGRCANWKQRAGEINSHIAIIEAELRQLGGRKAVHPRAEAAADLLAVFGANRDNVIQIATVIEPFAFSLFLEIMAIVAFGFGFAPRRTVARTVTVRHAEPTEPAPKPNDAPNRSEPPAELPNRSPEPSPAPKKPAKPAAEPCRTVRISKNQAAAELVTKLARGEQFGSQDELANRWHRSKSTVSEWLGEWERGGLIPVRQQDGRRKRVAA
jgi:hypothetical protein